MRSEGVLRDLLALTGTIGGAHLFVLRAMVYGKRPTTYWGKTFRVGPRFVDVAYSTARNMFDVCHALFVCFFYLAFSQNFFFLRLRFDP